MANRDTNTTVNYWVDGSSGTLIKARKTASIGQQSYWYNGSNDGYLAGSSAKPQPRYFAVLVGF
jgi:hypothetical protein